MIHDIEFKLLFKFKFLTNKFTICVYILKKLNLLSLSTDIIINKMLYQFNFEMFFLDF